MGRLVEIDVCLARLEKFKPFLWEEFAAEPDNFAIAEHYLRRALEAVLDVGRHILAKERLGKPRDYRAIIEMLGEKGVLPADFASEFKRVAGYRNRLVHLYHEVTPREIYEIIQHRLDDLYRYCGCILDYLEKTENAQNAGNMPGKENAPG